MELDSNLAGTLLRDFETTVNWRHTMNYAAAVDDFNEMYFDDEKEGGVIAPPMYSVALTWNILGRIWEFIDTDSFPMDIIARQVHYTEYLEFHRALTPGEKLVIKGKVAAILPHRAGTCVVTRFDAVDEEKKTVFTEFLGGLMRGVKCSGSGLGEDELPVIPANPEEAVEWESSIYISSLSPYIYDGCTDIIFPIHTSRKFARQVGLPGIILQGTATLAFALRELINREAGGDPRRVKRVYCRFTGMVSPGTDIKVRKTGAYGSEKSAGCFFDVLNSRGEKALKGGFAEILNR